MAPLPPDPALQASPARFWGWIHVLRISLFHASALLVLVVGWSPTALVVATACYLPRFFAVAAGYHRYFSHRSYRTSRGFQFLLALLGTSTGQKGPLSWATSHVLHHRHADRPGDPHSPVLGGLFHAHLGWLMRPDALPTDLRLVRPFGEYPELVWLNRLHFLGPALLLAGLWGLGSHLREAHPELGTGPGQLVVWGFVVTTLLILHGTCAVNSLGHRFGSQRFPGRDGSRNTWWLFPLTWGENWHNNHHRHPARATTSLSWWEFDPVHRGLLLLEALGLVQDLRGDPGSPPDPDLSPEAGPRPAQEVVPSGPE